MKRKVALSIAVVGLLAAPAIVAAQQWRAMGHHMMGPGADTGLMTSDCPMVGMMMRDADLPVFSEGRIAFLKAELAITGAQQPIWDTYAAAVKKSFSGMQSVRRQMMTTMSSKSPVERLDAHISAMEPRLAALKELKPALAALYGALSEEQKKKADLVLTGMSCMM